MGVATTSVIADRDPDTRAAVRWAVLERFTRLIAAADSATRTLAAWCGQPPTTRIHTREEAATLPEEAVLLGLTRARNSVGIQTPARNRADRELASRYRAGDRERSLD